MLKLQLLSIRKVCNGEIQVLPLVREEDEKMKIKVLMKRPDSHWYVTNVSNTLKNLQNLVGGYIETVTLLTPQAGRKGPVIICNEEGKLRGLPYNCTIFGEDFVGTILIAGVDGEEFGDLTDEQVKTLKPMLDNLRAMK